ncbi:hypothetical protein [Marivita sp.]|jgi:hypothetical protein|uniref:hypothetical protein n=1 Tax=Marivita sp. TaxID=2003365 RepID=UPI0032192EA1
MSENRTPLEINDAVDFYRQWPKLRGNAEQLLKAQALAKDDVEVLRWMIKVVDMVGPHDIKRESQPEIGT